MNVLIVSPFFPFPEDNGSKIRLVSLLKSLKNHDITIIAFKEQNELIKDEEIKNICSEYHIFNRPQISYFKELLNHFSSQPLLISRFFCKEAWEKTKEIVRNKKIDLFIIETLLMVKYAEKVPGTFLILDEHNLEFIRAKSRIVTSKNLLVKIYNYVIMVRLRRFELKAIRKFDCCMVCSDNDKNILVNLLKTDSVIVIPNAVDTDYYFLNRTSINGKKILFIGTLWYEPNRDAVLYFVKEILPLLKSRVPEVEFIVVGPGPTQDVIALSNQSNITVTGYVHDIRPYLSEASVFIVPIRMGSGTRLKILTAMSMGIPVVSTSVGMEGIAATNHKDICIADDPREFCDCIYKLLFDIQFSECIGSGGRALIMSQYSRNAIMERLSGLWDHIKEINCQ
ncbi:MAG: glycosyltransferase family 4 protein [Acidobacteria bacterium]|nr:glycosyltransferase family 4 protein [Acidobacteriota bacterium]MBU4308141.1 glycosyltransferase family 4 protein [Acidobacteriota bacterium]MBU4405695.1 glycosyltransferase family 4 protein [Acidobacteriota bacterium]MCG2811178.1 glycosyltransferase family 4 protein [Candidatus Aminicenantes bacterium]